MRLGFTGEIGIWFSLGWNEILFLFLFHWFSFSHFLKSCSFVLFDFYLSVFVSKYSKDSLETCSCGLQDLRSMGFWSSTELALRPHPYIIWIKDSNYRSLCRGRCNFMKKWQGIIASKFLSPISFFSWLSSLYHILFAILPLQCFSSPLNLYVFCCWFVRSGNTPVILGRHFFTTC